MTNPDDHAQPPTPARVLAWSVALPPIVLAAACVAGLGVARGVPTPLALLIGLTLASLPVLGLRTLFGPGRGRLVTASWLWPLAVLICLPLYFPGERREATEVGLRVLLAPTGEAASRVIADIGAGLTAQLSRDPKPLARSTRDVVAAEADPDPAPASAGMLGTLRDPGPEADTPRPAAEAPEVVVVPYEGDERSLRISVDIDGPVTGERFEMLFDTGATFSTVDAATLSRIGVPIPRDAPVVTLRTANGEIEAPLVLVDAIWLAGAPTEWVTVAVCDSCASPESVGLLGLNVSRRFRVSLDHDRRRIELRPRSRVDDRSLDIKPWLSLQSRAVRHWDGAVDLELTASSGALQPIERAIVDVSCSGQAFAVQLDGIPAKGSTSTEVSLPRGTDCREQRLEISSATWRLDRF